MATCKDGDLALISGENWVHVSLSTLLLHSIHKNMISPVCSVHEWRQERVCCVLTVAIERNAWHRDSPKSDRPSLSHTEKTDRPATIILVKWAVTRRHGRKKKTRGSFKSRRTRCAADRTPKKKKKKKHGCWRRTPPADGRRRRRRARWPEPGTTFSAVTVKDPRARTPTATRRRTNVLPARPVLVCRYRDRFPLADWDYCEITPRKGIVYCSTDTDRQKGLAWVSPRRRRRRRDDGDGHRGARVLVAGGGPWTASRRTGRRARRGAKKNLRPHENKGVIR